MPSLNVILHICVKEKGGLENDPNNQFEKLKKNRLFSVRFEIHKIIFNTF